MADREQRKAQAAKHISFIKGVFASETQQTVDNAVIYEEGVGRELALPEPAAETTATMVTRAFIPEALFRFGQGKTLVVDPASFTRPGGAYEEGAFGPEQIICAESNLYQVLCGIRETFHDKNRDYRRGMLCSDRAAYLPGIVFSHDGQVRNADVLAIAEPQRARALENHRSERECDNELASRIETILRIAAANECETLIVGAFACGRFGYDTQQVIGLFKAWIDEHPGAIAHIVFAVPRAFYDAFDEAFGQPAVEDVASTPEGEEADREDDADWAHIDLPEGVTLRR